MTQENFYQEIYPKLPQRWKLFFDTCPPRLNRKMIEAKTQGLIAERTLANMDSRGDGIPGGLLAGKKIAYAKEDVTLWLMNFCNETLQIEAV